MMIIMLIVITIYNKLLETFKNTDFYRTLRTVSSGKSK